MIEDKVTWNENLYEILLDSIIEHDGLMTSNSVDSDIHTKAHDLLNHPVMQEYEASHKGIVFQLERMHTGVHGYVPLGCESKGSAQYAQTSNKMEMFLNKHGCNNIDAAIKRYGCTVKVPKLTKAEVNKMVSDYYMQNLDMLKPHRKQLIANKEKIGKLIREGFSTEEAYELVI